MRTWYQGTDLEGYQLGHVRARWQGGEGSVHVHIEEGKLVITHKELAKDVKEVIAQAEHKAVTPLPTKQC